MNDKRTCGDCIHKDVCQIWMMNTRDITAVDASACNFYEGSNHSCAYLSGHTDAVRELARDADRPCTHGDGVIVRPDGRHELSPHRYKLTQRLRNVTVEVLTCETCGDVSVAWYRQDDTEDITDEG